MKNIQLCHIDRNGSEWTVTAHSEEGTMHVTFDCETEVDGLKLRNAIRDHAIRVRTVADYRDDIARLRTGEKDWMSKAAATLDAAATPRKGSE